MTVERNAIRRALPRSLRGLVGFLTLVAFAATPLAADPVDPFRDHDPLSMVAALGAARLPPDRPIRLDSAETARPIAPHRISFVGGHLLPRMNRQFAGMQLQAHQAGPAMTVGVFQEDLSLEARRLAERGARKAIRAFLLDATSLDRISDSVRRGAEERAASRPGRALRFRAGVSHGLPKAEMRYRGARTTMRMILGAARTASIDLASARRPGTRLSLRYDADDDRFRLACSHSF